MDVEKYIINLKAVIRNVPNKVGNIIDDNKEQILDLNRIEQLYNEGIDSNNRKLAEYKPFTIDIKRELGQPYNRTTLLYSGRFHDAFKYRYIPETFTLEIFSNDEKSDKLVEKYGIDIFGLNQSNKMYLNLKIIKPKLDEWILKSL